MPTEVLRPNAAGDLTNIWNQTPPSGEHWDKVDDVIPDEDDTRVWMPPYNAATRSDLFKLEPPGTYDINKVTIFIRVKETGYYTYNIYPKLLLKTHDEVFDHLYEGTSSSWHTISWILGNNPATDEPWTLEELTALQAGVALSANYGFRRDASGHCTQVYVEVDYAAVLPTVSADAATDIAANSATLNGTLDEDGGEACDCGFEWGETVAYGNTTPTLSKNTGETFSQALSGLDPGTTYHFRAFATNAAGTSYSADRTFSTLAVASSVTTDPATGVGMVVATLNGTLDDDGGEACDCGFEWGETLAYGNTTPTQSRTTGQTFSQAISGLIPGTNYHFRAFGQHEV